MSSPPHQKVCTAHKSFLEHCSNSGTVHSGVPAFSLATGTNLESEKLKVRPTCPKLKLSIAPFKMKSTAVITFRHWLASLVCFLVDKLKLKLHPGLWHLNRDLRSAQVMTNGSFPSSENLVHPRFIKMSMRLSSTSNLR